MAATKPHHVLMPTKRVRSVPISAESFRLPKNDTHSVLKHRRMAVFLGIDIGTSGTKNLAMNEDGAILSSATVE